MNQLEYEKNPTDPPPFWEMSYESTDDKCKHPLPGDWHFGGANDEDPRADPRWMPTTYTYLDDKLKTITVSQESRCDHEALGSQFQRADRKFNGMKVHFVMAVYPGSGQAVPIYNYLTQGETASAS